MTRAFRETFADITPDDLGPRTLLVTFGLGGVAVVAHAVELG